MAKLSAHGDEIGRIDYLTYRKAYMSDGHILKNYGDGWKLCAKCKPGIDPTEHYAGKMAALESDMRNRPAFAAYKDKLHDLANLSQRWRLDAAVKLMPNDPDGVWSETCDGFDAIDASIDDIASLCRAYRAAVSEAN